MSFCGAFVSLALNATLLGDQSLKIERQHVVRSTTCTAENEPSNPNAVVSLKDAKGDVVFSQKVHVIDFDFYNNGRQRGGLPATTAIVLLNYPRTAVTARASAVELRLISFPFHETARLPASVPNVRAHELSLK